MWIYSPVIVELLYYAQCSTNQAVIGACTGRLAAGCRLVCILRQGQAGLTCCQI